MCEEVCICARRCVYVRGGVYMCEEVCICARRCVYVRGGVYMCEEVCICARRCAHVRGGVYMCKEVCICASLQPIAFGVSFHLNLQSSSRWFLCNRTWQKRPIELDHHQSNDTPNASVCTYVGAAISKLPKIIGLFYCIISSLLQGSFARETYHFKDPTNRRSPIDCFPVLFST